MNRQQIAALPPIVAPTTGARSYSKIISGKRTGYYVLRARAGITLAGAVATVVKNGGSPWALCDFVGVEDNGDDRAYWPAMMMVALAKRIAYGGQAGLPSFTALGANGGLLGTVADGTYALDHTIVIPFAWGGPEGSGAPWETAHVQPDPRQDSFVFVVANNAATSLVDAGGTISTPLTVEVTQIFDDQRTDVLPYFCPRFRWIEQSIPGAVTELPFYIRATNPLRGLMFTQVDSNDGLVSDIATSVQLLDDAPDGQYIGPRAVPFRGLSAWEQYRYGATFPVLGNSAAAGVPAVMDGLGTYFHNWQDSGRLSMIYNPATAGNNLRLNVTGQPSVVGGGSAAMRCGIIELESIPGRTAIPTRANGQPIFTY